MSERHKTPMSDSTDTPLVDGQMDVAVQFILGLFLMTAFVGLVWMVMGGN